MTKRFAAHLSLLLSVVLLGCPDDEKPEPLPPTLSVSATSVSFGPATAGAAKPAAQGVTVSYERAPAVSSVAVATSYPGAVTGWLDAGLSGSGPYTLTLQPSTTALPAGAHAAAVQISATGAEPKTIAVTFTVGADEVNTVIAVDRAALHFAFNAGAAAPAAQELAISNAGTGTLDGITVSDDAAWLTATAADCPGASCRVTVAVDASLAVGTHAATVQISATGAVNSPLTIPVTCAVGQPEISASVPGLSFSTVTGAALVSKTFTVSNSGTGSLSRPVVTASETWLTAAVTGAASPYAVSVAVHATGLPAGTWAAWLTIESAGASNTPVILPISVVVSAPAVPHDPSTAGGAIATVADAVYARMADCEKMGAVFLSLAAQGVDLLAQRYQASADAGRIAYDQDALSGCLAAIRAMTCAELEGAEPPACAAVFTATVADGDACSMDEDCATGWCQDGGTCPFLCAAKKVDGATCDQGVECLSGACDTWNDECVPSAPGAAGEPCGYGDAECQAGLYCKTVYSPAYARICATLGSAGDPCTDFEECEDGLSCADDGVCRPLVAVGASCASAACGLGAYCSAVAGMRCADFPFQAGESCAETEFCYVTYCASSGRCVEGSVPVGGACDSTRDQFCAAGTSCSFMSDTCEVYASAPACP